MILRKLQNAPEKSIPVAMMFIAVGMMIIVVATVWHTPILPASRGTDWNDFLRGFMLGLAIVFEIFGLVLALNAARAKKVREIVPAPRP
jgi:hypothetical protein